MVEKCVDIFGNKTMFFGKILINSYLCADLPKKGIGDALSPLFYYTKVKMIKPTQIESIVADKFEQDDVFIVELNVHPGNKIVVVIDSSKGIPISYCVEISKLIESQFDREVEDFELEVSSAGIGQPFKVMKQYHKNLGREVEVLTAEGKKTCGKLLEVNDEGFTVEIGEMVKPEGKKRKELQVREVVYKFNEVKQVKDIISF